MVNTFTQSCLDYAKHKPRLQFELPPELMIDPDEPDWDYDMSDIEKVAKAAMRQQDRLDPGDHMRSWAITGQNSGKTHEGATLLCGSNTVSWAEKRMTFLSEENSLLIKSGRGRRHRKLPSKKANSKSCETEVIMGQEPDSRPSLTTDTEYAAAHRRRKKTSSKKPFRIIMPVMEESKEIAPEASCKDFDPLYPLMQGMPNYPPQTYIPRPFQCEGGPSENPEKRPSRCHTDDDEDNWRTLHKYGCTSLNSVSSESKHFFMPKHGAVSFDSKQSVTSPTSVVHTSSSLSVETSDTAMWELQRELSVLNRLSSIKTHVNYAKCRQVVRFAHPLVTAVKQRPRTLPEDVHALFFDPDELVTLEEERVARVYEEQVECVASGGDDEFAISVFFPVTRTLSTACDMTTFSFHDDDDDSDVYPAVEVEALPKTSREI
jgi:hypothetical protein